MRHVYAPVLGGALFKKKAADAESEAQESRSREAAIRKKVVDELRGREDALRQKEAELASREEELNRKSAELALKLQELAGRESEPGTGHGEAAGVVAKAGPTDALSAPEPDTLEGQEKLVNELELRLDAAYARRDEMSKKGGPRSRFDESVQKFRSKGLSVARLEAARGAGPGEQQKALERFEKDVVDLLALAKRCDSIDRVFAKEANALKVRCNDPDAIPAIEKGLKELDARAMARRKELMERVDGWRTAGYSVDRFAPLRNGDLGTLEEAAMKFEEDLEVLRMFSEKLDGMDRSVHKDAERLAPLLKDPDKLPELEKEMLAIEQRLGIQRQEFMELLEGWKSEGFRTEMLEKYLSSDMETLRKEFLRFDEDVRRLRSLAGRASKLEVGSSSVAAALAQDLKDPALLASTEATIIKLEEEHERKRGRAPASRVPAAAPAEARVPASRTVQTVLPARPAPAPDRTTTSHPVPTAPAPENAQLAQPAAVTAAALPASGPEAEVQAQVREAEKIIGQLEARHVETATAVNLLKLAKSFARSKNFAKALQYAKKATETAAGMNR